MKPNRKNTLEYDKILEKKMAASNLISKFYLFGQQNYFFGQQFAYFFGQHD
jgi:hypothetical protein